jgi:uncharacterized membrane-anchored protein YitT (DUF2179 family)
VVLRASLRTRGKNVRQILWNLVLLATGSCVCAVAVNGILIPRGFVSGGVTGLALIVHYVLPVFPVGALYLVFNVPLFALGWRAVSRRFFTYSLAGTALFSVAVQWVSLPIPLSDKLLCALLAGIIMGAGSGIILRSAGSGEATDIIYTVIAFRELAGMKKLLADIDPQAFVVVSDTAEVMGYRIGNQPHW